MKQAVATGTDLVFLLEQFCGRGYKHDDPSLQCYRGPKSELNRGSNSIYRFPLGPTLGTPEPVATLLEDPVDIHRDPLALYWTDHDGGSVWKLAK